MNAAGSFTPADGVLDELGVALLYSPPNTTPKRAGIIARRLLLRLCRVETRAERVRLARRILDLFARARLTEIRRAIVDGLRRMDAGGQP